MIKPSRHQAREIALQMLYRYDEAPAAADAHGAKPPQALIDELNGHFEHFQTPLELRSFTAELVAGTLRELPALDALLEKHASNWKIARMASVDRCLLRMAAYELGHFPDTPASVVIDEAIELAKQFGTAESPAFVNGVLDAIRSTVRP
jgi:N utilization substance protein B